MFSIHHFPYKVLHFHEDAEQEDGIFLVLTLLWVCPAHRLSESRRNPLVNRNNYTHRAAVCAKNPSVRNFGLILYPQMPELPYEGRRMHECV